MRFLRPFAVAALASAAVTGRAAAQVAAGHAAIRGTVMTGGHPLAGVLVMRTGSADSTRSDSAGRYNLAGLPAGRHIVEIRKRGYSPLEMEVNFPSDTTSIQFDIPMDPAVVDPGLADKLEREGFNERRRNARERDHLTFLDPQDLEDLEVVHTSQLLASVRDISTRYVGTSTGSISVVYGADQCPMYVWVDNQLIDNVFPPPATTGGASFGNRGSRGSSSSGPYTGLDNLLTVDRVGAIEVYPRPSQVPQRFQRSSSLVAGSSRDLETRSAECGALIIWTK